jgi:hypothetical protein
MGHMAEYTCLNKFFWGFKSIFRFRYSVKNSSQKRAKNKEYIASHIRKVKLRQYQEVR